MSDRWQMYSDVTATVAPGWRLDTVTPPSRLGGSNGMTFGPDGRLYVTQVFASQVTAIDIDSGAHEVFSPLGSGIVGPDDAIFGADGTFYATEPLIGRVTARNPDGSYRVLYDDLPAANGITMDHARRRLFVDEFRPGGRLMEVDPSGPGARRGSSWRTSTGPTPRPWDRTGASTSPRSSPTRSGCTTSTPAGASWSSVT